MSDTAVMIQNLDLIFAKGSAKEYQALYGINLRVDRGEFCILKGVSGSGKSTLLATIGALLKPSSGSLEVYGDQVSKMPDFHASKFRQETIGFVFQHFNLFDELSVLENVLTAVVPKKKRVKSFEKKARELLELVHLQDKKDTLAKNLSGGEKQRCAIARALINDPKLILADEPTANLDHANSLNVIEILKNLWEKGVTVIVATHDDIFEKSLQEYILTHIEDGKIV